MFVMACSQQWRLHRAGTSAQWIYVRMYTVVVSSKHPPFQTLCASRRCYSSDVGSDSRGGSRWSAAFRSPLYGSSQQQQHQQEQQQQQQQHYTPYAHDPYDSFATPTSTYGHPSSFSSPSEPISATGSFLNYPPPPPPPPPPSSSHPYAPQNHTSWYYAAPPPLSAAAATPNLSSLGLPSNLGSQERPIVVTAAQSKFPLLSWLGKAAFFSLGLAYLVIIISNIYVQFSDGNGGPYGIGGGEPGDYRGMGGGGSHVSSNQYGQSFGEFSAKPVDLTNLDVTFGSICGCDEAKQELEVIVEFLKDPQKFKEIGGRLPKGALLVGPPGCGKTLLAKAIAKEANVNFFYATGSEFDELFVGVGSRRVRDLFAAAKAKSPSLIFIDEIDALGGKRSKSDHAYSRMTLNQLLAEMDGFQSNDAVVVLAATNTPEALDKALTRAGRLDTTIAVDPPDMKGRAEVLQIYLNKVKTDSSVRAMDIAQGTTGFTGAELSNLVNLAAIHAAVNNQKVITCEDVEYAKDRVVMGTESKKVIPESDRRITAYHEGAHALTAVLLQSEGAEPVHKATIVPRGSGIMGLVQQIPEKDVYSVSKRQLLARLKVCVAGRVGEELLLGSDDITTGASSDFHKASYLARDMVRRFGFSDSIGFVDYESADTPEGAYMSEETKRKIEKAVEQLLTQAYKETRELMQRHRAKLELIAESLLKYETLTSEDLAKLMRGEALPPKPPRVTSSTTDGGGTDGGREDKASRGQRNDNGGSGGTGGGVGTISSDKKRGRTVPID